MSDEVDVSNENIERDVNIATRLAGMYVDKAVYTGECLTCDKKVIHPKRWCDADCRDIHEHKQKLFRR